MNHTQAYYYRRCCYCPFLRGKDLKVTQMRCEKNYDNNGWITVDSYIVNIDNCYYVPDYDNGIMPDENRQFTIYRQ